MNQITKHYDRQLLVLILWHYSEKLMYSCRASEAVVVTCYEEKTFMGGISKRLATEWGRKAGKL